MTLAQLARWKERLAGLDPDDAPAMAEELLAEVERLTQHSTCLNTIAFRIAEALGDVTPGADHVEGNPLDLAEQLIADREESEKDAVALRDELDETSIELDVAQAALHRIHDRADMPASVRTITEHALRNERWDDSVPPGGWVCAIDSRPTESEPCPDHGHTGAPWCCDTCKTTAAVLDAEIVEAARRAAAWRPEPVSRWELPAIEPAKEDAQGWYDDPDAEAGHG